MATTNGDSCSTDTLEYFKYLDNLRDSGITNMFGARPYLQEAFGLDRHESQRVLMGWMKTCDGESSVLKRASTFEATA